MSLSTAVAAFNMLYNGYKLHKECQNWNELTTEERVDTVMRGAFIFAQTAEVGVRSSEKVSALNKLRFKKAVAGLELGSKISGCVARREFDMEDALEFAGTALYHYSSLKISKLERKLFSIKDKEKDKQKVEKLLATIKRLKREIDIGECAKDYKSIKATVSALYDKWNTPAETAGEKSKAAAKFAANFEKADAEFERGLLNTLNKEKTDFIPPLFAFKKRSDGTEVFDRCAISGKPIRNVLITVHPDDGGMLFEKSEVEAWIKNKPDVAPPKWPTSGWPNQLPPLPITAAHFKPEKNLQKAIERELEMCTKELQSELQNQNISRTTISSSGKYIVASNIAMSANGKYMGSGTVKDITAHDSSKANIAINAKLKDVKKNTTVTTSTLYSESIGYPYKEKLPSHRTLLLSLLLKNELEKHSKTYGKAVDNGDCFFHSFAQALNMLNRKIELPKSVTIDELRKKIRDFVNAPESCERAKALFFKESPEQTDAEKQIAWEEYKKGIAHSFSNLNITLTWGKPVFEGRVLCELYKVNLRTVDAGFLNGLTDSEAFVLFRSPEVRRQFLEDTNKCYAGLSNSDCILISKEFPSIEIGCIRSGAAHGHFVPIFDKDDIANPVPPHRADIDEKTPSAFQPIRNTATVSGSNSSALQMTQKERDSVVAQHVSSASSQSAVQVPNSAPSTNNAGQAVPTPSAAPASPKVTVETVQSDDENDFVQCDDDVISISDE